MPLVRSALGRKALWLSLLLVPQLSCQGTDVSTAPWSPAPTQALQPMQDLPYVAASVQPAALRARTWKLSHLQYAAAVKAFVGAESDTRAFEVELDNGVYPNMSGSGLVRVTLARSYYESAERIAAALTAEQLSALIDGEALTPAQKPAFIASAIRRAFRRPPTQEDLDTYAEIFDQQLGADGDETSPFRAVIRTLLSSPFFLYRTEIGLDPARQAFELTGYEVASLLSFSLLGAPPTQELLQAAASGELTSEAGLVRNVNALLDTPEAAASLQTFLLHWLKLQRFLELDKDAPLFPEFRAMRPAMLQEAHAYLAAAGGMTGTWAGLLTTPITVDPGLADYYGGEASAQGEVGERLGILGLGAVIAAHSRLNGTSPTQRGLFIRDRLLCQQIHLPPDTVPNIVETLVTGLPKTTRETYEMHAHEPACAGCHAQLDGIGFSFEHFDASGRYRNLENDVPIDASGQLLNSDVSGPLSSYVDLARRLADSAWATECMALQAFRFYFGQVETDRGTPAVQAARSALTRGTFRALVAALMTSPSVRQRVRQP